MALHGEIKVNGSIIHHWEAVRQVELEDTTQVSTYECRFDWFAPWPGHVVFHLMHRYDRGAPALAQRVVQVGEKLMHERLANR